MSPTSLVFGGFFVLVCAVYWLLPRRAAWQNTWLLVASYAFFASWSASYVPLLLAVTTLDYFAAQRLEETSGERERRLWLWLSVASNLGVLVWFKAQGAFDSSIAVPIGLSYWTLIKFGYVWDVAGGRQRAERSWLNFATYVAFFPQTVAGPISRAAVMLPQLDKARLWEWSRLSSAAGALLLGCWMKLYIADWIAPALVDPMFDGARPGNAAAYLFAIIGYAIQVFSDFAGYSLLAIGVARLLGVELPVNFDRPYVAKSMPEFWRRWHISLNTWLFDYVYGPLTTGRGPLHGFVATNLVLVMLLSGLWHGSGWTFTLWGLGHGLVLALHFRWDAWYRARCRVDRRWVSARKHPIYSVAAWGLTLTWFLISLVLFRSESLTQAGQMLHGLTGRLGADGPSLDAVGAVNFLVALTFVTWHHLEGFAWAARLRARAFSLPSPVVGAAAALVVVWMLVFAPLARGTFIYAQF
jgi:alginate O-acetyltransferase complex protein AlgI